MYAIRSYYDAKQQITPEQLHLICNELKIREIEPSGISYETLEELRFKIDNFDQELLELLGKRMQTSEAIGLYKKQNNMTILQSNRWA